MSILGDRLDQVIPVLLPVAIVALGCGVSLLPHGVVAQATGVLAAWLMLSLPVGVFVGHCMLGEAD